MIRRTVGIQFPPFSNDNPDSWGVQHTMHPDLGKTAAVFSDWYTSDALTSVSSVTFSQIALSLYPIRSQVCAELLECEEEDLELGLFIACLIFPASYWPTFRALQLVNQSIIAQFRASLAPR